MSAGRAKIPPPDVSTPLTDAQHSAIVALIGIDAPTDVVVAIRDARGKFFQRLEFLGDSVLETVEALDGIARTGEVPQHDGTTDAALSDRAQALGIREWLEWEPSTQRLADLVEAVAGGAYLSGGWPQVGRVYARLRGSIEPPVGALLASPSGEPTPAFTTTLEVDRAHATLGASILETAATEYLVHTHPEADEGELSNLRRDLHLTRFIAAWGQAQGLPRPAGEWRATSDIVETWLGSVALHSGPATAVAHARTVLLDGRAS